MALFDTALRLKLARRPWRLIEGMTVTGRHRRALGGKGEYAGVTLIASAADVFSFESRVQWPTDDCYEDVIREAAFDVLLCSGQHNASGVALVLDAIEWHDIDSCAAAFYWAARSALLELADFDPHGYPRRFTWKTRTGSPADVAPVRWAVWRQDDNGNRFRISGGHDRAEAERLCAELEARGHKQMYWTSPDEG